MTDVALTSFLQYLDLIGVLFNAMVGAVIARNARLDPMGFGVLAIMSGLGGGLIRDTLLQAGPPLAIVDWRYFTTAIAGALIVTLVHIEGRWWERLYPPIDALAVGCWAAAGAAKTVGLGHGWLPAILMGTITAVGGSFVRDMVLRQVPAILGGNTLYATWAIAAAGITVVGAELGQTALGSVVATLVGAGLVLLSKYKHWALPQGDDAATVGEAVQRMLARRSARAGEHEVERKSKD
ncbi:MAG: trimeric intracellular cation channel family protein [Propionibacteriaceae bacterium]|nr:trimeric intracellular cation channel family protein [Propionibacteriaceae bacterium]